MPTFCLYDIIPADVNETDIVAESLNLALKFIATKYPSIQRFSIVSPDKKVSHYKIKNKKIAVITHRDFDHLTIDRLKEMLRDAGLTPPSLKSKQLDWIDHNETYVRGWLAKRKLMAYLGDDFSVEKTEEGLTVTREEDYFVLESPKDGKGLINSYIKLIDVKDKFKALAESRKEELAYLKNANLALVEIVKECLGELKEIRTGVTRLEESIKEVKEENISLKSELTLATFSPIGSVIEKSNSSGIFDDFF